MPLLAGIGGLIGGLASAATVGYQISQGGGGSSGRSGVGGYYYGLPTIQQTPQEQAFYQMQTLLNEQAANANAQASVETANAAYEATQTSNAWFKYAMTGLAILIAYLWLKRRKIV